jgi:hypothetical protein
MLRAIRRWWEGYSASVPKSEVVDSIPESQWGRSDLLPPVSRAKRKAFIELLQLIYSHLPPEQAAASVDAGAKAFVRGDEPDSALSKALLPDQGDAAPKGLGFIGVDWKDAREVEWQADRLCEVHGLSGRWQSPGGTLPAVLGNFDAWLRTHNLELLCLADGDLVVAFALSAPRAAQAKALGTKLRLPLRSASEA